MLLQYMLLLFVSAGPLTCDEICSNGNQTVSSPEEDTGSSPVQITEESPVTSGDELVTPTVASTHIEQSKKPPRRRGRRQRGYYNDFRYRDPSNNPYNPNSPYSFRGRPARPQPAYQTGYNAPQYYDPYNQYYGYQQQYYQPQGYYPYPYPAQPHHQPPPPQPPTPPATEKLPDLYYVQSADGQYQYKKVPVQDHYGARRRGPTRSPLYPQQPYQQGYYNQPYDPYRRSPPNQYYQQYPYNQQQYTQQQYNQQQYQQQYPPYYQYPKVPGGPRSRLRGGLPPLRSTALPGPSSWKLTSAPTAVFDLSQNHTPSEKSQTDTQPGTEKSIE